MRADVNRGPPEVFQFGEAGHENVPAGLEFDALDAGHGVDGGVVGELEVFAVEFPESAGAVVRGVEFDFLFGIGEYVGEEEQAATDVVGGFVEGVDEVEGVEGEAIFGGADGFDGANAGGLDVFACEGGDVAEFELFVGGLAGAADGGGVGPGGVVVGGGGPVLNEAGGLAGVELFFPALLATDAGDGPGEAVVDMTAPPGVGNEAAGGGAFNPVELGEEAGVGVEVLEGAHAVVGDEDGDGVSAWLEEVADVVFVDGPGGWPGADGAVTDPGAVDVDFVAGVGGDAEARGGGRV